jgi:HAD superfamily hydrolase (TIGR01509 family)
LKVKENMSLELVIFDCDGVLVDSELLATRALVDQAGELGLTLDLHETEEKYRGWRFSDTLDDLEALLGRPLPQDFLRNHRARSDVLFQAELTMIEGIDRALAAIGMPFCVASNGTPEKIRLSLRKTGLYPLFGEGRIFSAYEVGIWKPDPGLFLHAAAAMGAKPQNCIVVEDSVPGVRAAIAAGMRVFGYAAVPGSNEALTAEGAHTFSAMEMLPALLAAA